jgi:ribosomal protein S18 acetylase RimI-like enzyme
MKGAYMLVDNYSEMLWEIYTASFPPDERRSYNQQKEIMKNDKYNVIPYLSNNKLIGFLAYWDLTDFIFIEHFAFSSKMRGMGLGSKYLKEFLNKVHGQVILEVEPISDDITLRRVGFYKRLGFELNRYDYYQPPFDKSKEPVNLQLMSYNKGLNHQEFQLIKEKLYKDVYEEIA